MEKYIVTKIGEYFNENIDDNSDVLYHATNSTWTKPQMNGLGFHAGTLKAAKDRMKSFREIAEMHYATEPSNEFDEVYKENRISALEKLLSEQLGKQSFSSSACEHLHKKWEGEYPHTSKKICQDCREVLTS